MGKSNDVVDKKVLMGAALFIVCALIFYQAVTGTGVFNRERPYERKPGEPLVIMEFSDFKCGYCAKSADALGRIRQEYGNKVLVVYKHHPLPYHEGADRAAEAAECARDQGMFWEYHDALFEGASSGYDIGTESSLTGIASSVGLDTSEFDRCLTSGEKKAVIAQHMTDAAALGVDVTPVFFVEGRKLVGWHTHEEFKEVIDPLLGD